MAYDYYRRVPCPLCEVGEMRAVNPSLARCSRCDGTMSHGLYDVLLEIRALPEVRLGDESGRIDAWGRGRGGD